jgi:hypothetical protein
VIEVALPSLSGGRGGFAERVALYSPPLVHAWWGMTLALIAFLPTIIGIFNVFRAGISENKATGLGAVAVGLTEAYATLGLILTLMLPVAAIVLLGKSLSRLHPMRALLSWLSICGSVLVLVLSGLSIWVLFIHTSQAASVAR